MQRKLVPSPEHEVSTKRSILQFRRANQRSPHTFYERAPHLPLQGRIYLNAAVQNSTNAKLLKTRYLVKTIEKIALGGVSRFQQQLHRNLIRRLRLNPHSSKSSRVKVHSRLHLLNPIFVREHVDRAR